MLFVFWVISLQKFSHFVPVIFASQFSLSRRTNGAGSGRGCHQLRWDFYDSPLPRLSFLARANINGKKLFEIMGRNGLPIANYYVLLQTVSSVV